MSVGSAFWTHLLLLQFIFLVDCYSDGSIIQFYCKKQVTSFRVQQFFLFGNKKGNRKTFTRGPFYKSFCAGVQTPLRTKPPWLEIILWIIVLPSNSINIFYGLFHHTNMSPDSQMKLAYIYICDMRHCLTK